MVNTQKTRSVSWESTHLSTWAIFVIYDWLSLKPLGNTGSRKRSRNNFTVITMGIGPIWGINSLTPSSSLVQDGILETISIGVPLIPGEFCFYRER